MSELYLIPPGVSTRWATPENPSGSRGSGGSLGSGRKGMAHFAIRPGRRIVLARADGHSGVVRRIWLTFHDLSPLMLRQLRITCYWDAAERPAVDVPLGDFFGMGLGRRVPFAGALFSSPEGRSFVCTVPMPFRCSMRIEVHNDGISTAAMFYYEVDYTLGDRVPADAGYFHAWYNQELPTKLGVDYTVLDAVRGRGRFLGASFGVVMDRERYGSSWGGEGEVKIYLDGDTSHPTLCGTGTEDYVGTGWCQGVFSHAEQGFTIADEAAMALAFYRYHVADPVWFEREIRVTIQQIGSWNPELLEFLKERGRPIHQAGLGAAIPPEPLDFSRPDLTDFGLFEREDCWNSCAYFYLDRPDHDLPAPPCLAERARALPGFDPAELATITNDLPVLRLIRERIPEVDRLEVPDLRRRAAGETGALADALTQVAAYLEAQEKALRENHR